MRVVRPRITLLLLSSFCLLAIPASANPCTHRDRKLGRCGERPQAKALPALSDFLAVTPYITFPDTLPELLDVKSSEFLRRAPRPGASPAPSLQKAAPATTAAPLATMANATATTGDVTGHVTSVTDGHALPGAQVTLGSSSTVADANGAYSFTNFAPGNYTLTAFTTGYLSRNYTVAVNAGSVTTQDVQLSVAGILAGVIKNSAGQTVSGANVQISGGVLNQSFNVTTDGSGNYNSDWVPVGNYVMAVTAQGYVKNEATVGVYTGKTTFVNLVLSSGLAVPFDYSLFLSRFSRPLRSTTTTISPRQAAVTFTQTQQFTSNNPVAWSVDGVLGGNTTVGTISASGVYTPPTSVGQHTITAANQANASDSVVAKLWVTNGGAVVTQHNDNYRTGQNTNETVLASGTVSAANFGLLRTYPVDGLTYAEPLYVPNLQIPNAGYRNVVFVATEHDSVYAFDADGRSPTTIWYRSFIDPANGITTDPRPSWSGLGPETGVTSTPVIDTATGTIYVVAARRDNGIANYRLHALDITTGAEKFGGPVILSGSVPGSGVSSNGGQLAFDASQVLQRPALLLTGGVLYIAFGSYDDFDPYHGWVFLYSASTLAKISLWCPTPDGTEGGIWQSGGGFSADSGGNVFLAIGNGTFTGATGGSGWGESVLKWSPSSSTILDYFTPYNWQDLQIHDFDLGSGPPMLIPDGQSGSNWNLLIVGGKGKTLYLLNRDNLGQFHSTGDTVVQSIPNAAGEMRSSPAFWNGTVYVGGLDDYLRAFRLSSGLLSTTPVSQTSTFFAAPGAPTPSISSNGTADGIVWVMEYSTTNEVLHAYDATNLANELFNSMQAGSRDQMGTGTRLTTSAIADGKVFVPTNHSLAIFGLLP